MFNFNVIANHTLISLGLSNFKIVLLTKVVAFIIEVLIILTKIFGLYKPIEVVFVACLYPVLNLFNTYPYKLSR